MTRTGIFFLDDLPDDVIVQAIVTVGDDITERNDTAMFTYLPESVASNF